MSSFEGETLELESQYPLTNLSVTGSYNLSDFENATEDEWDWLWGEQDPFEFPQSFIIAAHILYNIILILGVAGNGCALLIFTIKKPKFRKLPIPLLANLAVGDLLITVFCLETSYLSLLWQYWPFGKFLCFALSPVKPIAVFVNCYTLIALSVDRYLGVKNPLNSRLSKYNVKLVIALIWFLAICTSLPTGLFTSYEMHLLTGLPRCGEYAWESEMKEMIYDLSLITLQFVIPVLVLIYTYTRISIVVYRNKALRHRMSQGTSPRKKSFRTLRMSLMVVMGYTLAWLPYNLVSLLAKYNETLGDSDHFPYIFIGCHWLAMSHSVYNPVIYFWLNDSFRTSILELCCRKRAIDLHRRRMSSTHMSWRTSAMYTNGTSSIASRPASRTQRLQSDDGSRPGTPLIKATDTCGCKFPPIIENESKDCEKNLDSV